MTIPKLLDHRLRNQQISDSVFSMPVDIVTWMGAMQAQEYAMAKWAIGMRLPEQLKIFDTAIEMAFNNGNILRTHILRPTWHFVSSDDIRWMLSLSAQRVHAANASMYRKLELDNKIFKRTNEILARALSGGKHLTRDALKLVLEKNKVSASGLRLVYIMMFAELEGLICSGPRHGKQFTYALLDDKAASPNKYDPLEALYQLTKRYFFSRGPATLKDFVWWSGLTVRQAKEGLELVKQLFVKENIGGIAYYYPDQELKNLKKPQKTFLMADYDEYAISYKDRSALRATVKKIDSAYKSVNDYSHWFVVDGKIAGTWKLDKKTNKAEVFPFIKLNANQASALKKAVKRFNVFVAG